MFCGLYVCVGLVLGLVLRSIVWGLGIEVEVGVGVGVEMGLDEMRCQRDLC